MSIPYEYYDCPGQRENTIDPDKSEELIKIQNGDYGDVFYFNEGVVANRLDGKCIFDLSVIDFQRLRVDARSFLVEVIGIDPELADADSEVVARQYFRKRLDVEVSSIPLYLDEKATRNGDWDARRHYDRYWCALSEIGVLFLDELRRIDRRLVDALASWANRRGQKSSEVLPRAQKFRTDLEAELITKVFGESAKNVGRAQTNRKRKRRKVGDAIPTP